MKETCGAWWRNCVLLLESRSGTTSGDYKDHETQRKMCFKSRNCIETMLSACLYKFWMEKARIITCGGRVHGWIEVLMTRLVEGSNLSTPVTDCISILTTASVMENFASKRGVSGEAESWSRRLTSVLFDCVCVVVRIVQYDYCINCVININVSGHIGGASVVCAVCVCVFDERCTFFRVFFARSWKNNKGK